MNKAALVTGAGSGVGQAIAIALAQQNWQVALVGRREETLRETVKRTGKKSKN
jgi:NADP-dependent 3-hydroxy acid dehydrogenase YdfG